MRTSVLLLPILSAAVSGTSLLFAPAPPPSAENCPTRNPVISVFNNCSYDVSVSKILNDEGADGNTVQPGTNYTLPGLPAGMTGEVSVPGQYLSIKPSDPDSNLGSGSFNFEHGTYPVFFRADGDFLKAFNPDPFPISDLPPNTARPVMARLTTVTLQNFDSNPFQGSNLKIESYNNATGYLSTVVYEGGVIPSAGPSVLSFACSAALTVTTCSA